MAILVAGGAGFVGSHLVLGLLDAGEEAIVLDDLSTGSQEAVAGAARLIVGDIGDSVLLARVFDAFPIDALVHLAGPAAGAVDPVAFHLAAAAKSRDLIAAAAAAGVARAVFLSSAEVYGPAASDLSEEAPVDPDTPLGAWAAATERMLAAAPLNHVALRVGTVAGADPVGRTGRRGPAGDLLASAVAAAGKGDPIAVFGTDFATPDGTEVADYLHVADLVSAVMAALRHLAAGGPSLTLNCGYGHGASALEVLEAIQTATRRPLDIRPRGQRPGQAGARVLPAVRIRDALDWRPRFDDLHAIVRHALRWEERRDTRRAA